MLFTSSSFLFTQPAVFSYHSLLLLDQLMMRLNGLFCSSPLTFYVCVFTRLKLFCLSYILQVFPKVALTSCPYRFGRCISKCTLALLRLDPSLSLYTASLHRDWIIFYLQTALLYTVIGPFSNSKQPCSIVIGSFSSLHRDFLHCCWTILHFL